MYLTGRRGHQTEGYPEGNAGGAAALALRNRNVANNIPPPLVPFTPTSGSLVAAILFTPKVSGVIQISANLLLINDVNPDTYAMVALVIEGTGLTVTGGASTINGWVIGSTVPPTIGGIIGANVMALEAIDELAAGDIGSYLVFGISDPLPVNVPVLIEIALGENVGGNAISSAVFSNLSVLELP